MSNFLKLIKAKIRSLGASIIVIARLISALLGLVSALLIASYLGPVGRGLSAASLSALLIFPVIASLGLPTAVRRRVAEGGNLSSVRSVHLYSVIIIIPSILVGIFLVTGPLSQLNESERVATVVGMALTPVSVIWLTHEGVLIAQKRYASVAAVQTVGPLAFLGILSLSVALGVMTVLTIVIANITAMTITLFLAVMRTKIKWIGPRDPLRNILKEGLSYAGSQASEAASRRLDQIILLPLIGPYELGLYSVAATIGLIPIAIGGALTARSFTEISVSTGENRTHLQAEAVRAGIYWGLLASIFNGFVGCGVIILLFGPTYIGAIIPCVLASAGTGILITSTVASNALIADARGWAMTAGQFIGLMTGIILMILLAPDFGAVGAALASTLGYLAALGFILWKLKLPLGLLVLSNSRIKSAFKFMFSN